MACPRRTEPDGFTAPMGGYADGANRACGDAHGPIHHVDACVNVFEHIHLHDRVDDVHHHERANVRERLFRGYGGAHAAHSLTTVFR